MVTLKHESFFSFCFSVPSNNLRLQHFLFGKFFVFKKKKKTKLGEKRRRKKKKSFPYTSLKELQVKFHHEENYIAF